MTRSTTRTTAGLLALGAPLLVYLATLARQVTETDSGELAAAAATLGIAHPPGYPLFTLAGWLLSWLPVGSIAFRIGLVSALAAAGAALVIFRLGLAVGTSVATRAPTDGETGRPAATGTNVALAMAALAAALLVAFGRTFWSQAVIVEVYGLQALLTALVLAACWRASEPQADLGRAWPLAGAAAGLAAVNHLTGVLLWPAVLATLAFGLRRSRPRTLAILARTAAAAALPLLLYLYLPLRSAASPEVRWTVVDSLQSFLVHVSARQYHGLWGSRGLRIDELWRFLGKQLPAEASLLLPFLAVVGLVVVARRRPGFALASGLALATTVVYNLGYPIPDIAAYYLPAFVVLGVLAAAGAVAITAAAARRRPIAGAAVAGCLVAASLTVLANHWQACDRHDDRLVACAVRDTLAPLAPDAVLITGRSDVVSSPALYEQDVEGFRPDVLVLDVGRMADPRYGLLLGGAAAELAAVARRPTYVISDLYTSPLVRGLTLVPESLVARAARRDELRPVPLDAIEGPCGARDRLRFPAHKLVWDDYRVAMLNRAQYLRRHGMADEAARYEARATEIGEPLGSPE